MWGTTGWLGSSQVERRGQGQGLEDEGQGQGQDQSQDLKLTA